MLSFNRFTALIISAVGFSACVIAAPVEASNNLVTRGPYDVHNGWATYYNPSVGLGACGWANGDGELVAAVGTTLYQDTMVDANPNHNPICGRIAAVTYAGKTIQVKVVDRCYACGYNDIDLSPAAFQQFAPLAVGKLQAVSWRFT
ncbi:Lytic transglycosylase, partial [Rhizoctonia solani]